MMRQKQRRTNESSGREIGFCVTVCGSARKWGVLEKKKQLQLLIASKCVYLSFCMRVLVCVCVPIEKHCWECEKIRWKWTKIDFSTFGFSERIYAKLRKIDIATQHGRASELRNYATKTTAKNGWWIREFLILNSTRNSEKDVDHVRAKQNTKAIKRLLNNMWMKAK